MRLTRKYNVADALFLEFTSLVIKYLEEDLVQFTVYDPDLNAGKYELLKTLYEKGLNFGTDESEVDQQSVFTESMKGVAKKCKSVYRDIRYFARKKFKNNPAILNQFGVNKFRKVRNTKAELILFMFEVESAANTYKNELMEAGLSEIMINSIKPAVEALENSCLDQEAGKKGRSVKTEERIILLNSVYDILINFSEAAKNIFASNNLHRLRYILPYKK